MRLEIVGDLHLKNYLTGETVNARGMVYTPTDPGTRDDMTYMSDTTAPWMVQAIVEPFSADGETPPTQPGRPPPEGVYPNDCKSVWGASVTHRVRVITALQRCMDSLPVDSDRWFNTENPIEES